MNSKFLNISDLACYKNGGNRLLGIDHGERRVGLSISDVTWLIASPFKILEYKNEKQFFQELQKIQKDFNIAACVLGMPTNMNGSKGPQSVKVEEFSLKLAEYTNMPFCFWDERWSTQAVEKMMVHADLSRNKRDKNRDALAAAYILQGALDSLRFAQS